jgi:hypothetical protein
MKVGDLVKTFRGTRMGMVVKLFDKKIWRTHALGKKVNWNKIDPEPVADVMIDERIVTIPLIDLEVINESR